MIPNTLHLGSFQAEKNGEQIKYRTQNVTPDLKEEVIDHMVKHFVPREPLCSFTELGKDPDSLNSIIKLWDKGLSGGASIVALLEDKRGARGKVIGANVTSVSKKEKDKTKDEELKGERFHLVLEAVIVALKRGNIYEKYGIDKYLTAFGLSVSSDYHGYNVGYNILASREPLCKAIGLDVTGTVFTAGSSQHIAKKVGFETLYECDYENFDLQGGYPLRNIYEKLNAKKITLMALKYHHNV